jgi:uncharacterized repeat protein (TIGR03803 family)
MRLKSAGIILMTFAVAIFSAATAHAQTERYTVLYNFTGGTDGGGPGSGLIQNHAGNLYGTASSGGDLNCIPPYGCGVVFEMTTAGTETVLHTFTGYPSDGALPYTPVAQDVAGNLYGTTADGGSTKCPYYGCGTVYKIDSAGNETVLHSFTGGSDGCTPWQGVALNKDGALFGTTSLDCSAYVTIFEIDSAGNYTIPYAFSHIYGEGPEYGHLTMDASSNLYGTLRGGGSGHDRKGLVYRLKKDRQFTILHRFRAGPRDGQFPFGSVVRDKAGSLYGTTKVGGHTGGGTIWKVTKTGKKTILHDFAGRKKDGCAPMAGLARDPGGNLYGVTAACGASDDGVLFELSTKGELILLHTFRGPDGADPIGEVLLTANGTLYGTTARGGAYGAGTVWKYVP